MEAKTKVHLQVAPLQRKLPKITPTQEKWAYNNCVGYYAMISRNRVNCLECKHKWQDNILIKEWEIEKLKTLTTKCPSCKRKLEVTPYNNPVFSTTSWWAVWTTFKGYQVLRLLYIQKVMAKGKDPWFHTGENLQYWIGKDGSLTLYSRIFNSYYGGATGYNGSLSLRPNGTEENERYDIAAINKVIYPKVKILPEIYRNGFDGNFYGISPHFVFAFLNTVYGETLHKTGKTELFKLLAKKRRIITPKIWTAIKICLRHNYDLNKKNLSDWLDYVRLLIYFKKDIHNPHYVCPKDLHKEHNMFVQRKMKIDEENKVRREATSAETGQKRYEDRLGKFFDLILDNGKGLVITPIKSINQCFEESKKLGHCAFTNSYYKKKNVLLMTASFQDKLMETIEINLDSMELVQARGKQNRPSIHNKDIKNLIRNNMEKIKLLNEPPKIPKRRTKSKAA